MKNAQWFRLQRAAALVFAVFLSLHLMNALLLLGGPVLFERFLTTVRPLYQNIVVEIILLAGLIVHVAASIVLWRRRPDTARRSLGQQIQTWAGLIVLLFVPGHILFLRVLPAVYGFKPDFDFLWMAMEIWPTLFLPYYAVFGAAAAFHLAWGALLFFKKRRETVLHYAVYSIVGLLFLSMSIRVATSKPSPDMNDEKIARYLEPYQDFTPWLVDMADRHPFIIENKRAK